MIRRFTVASIVVLALLIVAARAIGSTNKPPALAMLDPGDCPQPCWHGIRPGVTTVEEAKALIDTDPAFEPVLAIEGFEHCWRTTSLKIWAVCIKINELRSTKELVYGIWLWIPQGRIRLGDIINQLGEPLSVGSCPGIRDLDTTLAKPHWAISLTFRGNIFGFAYKSGYPTEQIPDPTMIIYYLSYKPADQVEDPANLEHLMWSGFHRLPVMTHGCGVYPTP